MTGKHTGLSEEEVLLAFAVEPIHNRKTLEHYLGEYPEHANALVDCSIELMVDATRGDEVALTSETVVDQAWQRFQITVGQPAGVSRINPFATLNPTDFRLLARKLDINNLLLVRLRDRAINAATIPQRLIQALATELGATVETVMAYLRNPPAMVSGHSYLSVSDLSRKLSSNPDDSRRFSVDDLEKFLRVTGDMTPIYWLIEQFLEDADVRQRRALAELSKLMPQLAALLKQAGGT